MKRIHFSKRTDALIFHCVLGYLGFSSSVLYTDCYFYGGSVLEYPEKVELLLVALLDFHACDFHREC